MLKKSDQNLIWIDCEMTGLDPSSDRLIEIATVITDSDLSVRVEGPVIAIHQSDELMGGMDAWNRSHHGKSGLVDRVKASSYSAADAEAMTLEFVSQYVDSGQSPICGNSVHQDKRFLYNEMPNLAGFFHYRHLDVSTVKLLAKAWAPSILNKVTKQSAHQALLDVHDSIDELLVYKESFFNLKQGEAG